MTTQEYIRLHADDDVRQLALKGAKDEAVDLSFALDQIRGRQVARVKMPSWAAVDGIIYPRHLSMEQCSSEATARYKAGILSKAVGPLFPSNGRFVDLTGGLGVDFSFMARGFADVVYVERNQGLCDIATHNMPLLGLDATIVNTDGTEYLRTMPSADAVFLDPARRDNHGGRTYALADCTPNVIEMLPLLTQKARTIVLKLSPMLDWRKAVGDLTDGRELSVEVHIVSLRNECKELVIALSASEEGKPLHVVCANLAAEMSGKEDEIFEFDAVQLSFTAGFGIKTASFEPTTDSFWSETIGTTPLYLYEPNASIMKAGCFDTLCQRYDVVAIAHNSHLFVSDKLIEEFPGRRFRIISTSSMNKKELRRMLSGISQANITVRNFPMTADELRRKLKLKDGGSHYLFATTDAVGRHLLLLLEKA